MNARKRPLKGRSNPIEYAFVLMLENRSFDHFAATAAEGNIGVSLAWKKEPARGTP